MYSNTFNISTRLDLLLNENNVMLMPGEHTTARLTTLFQMPLLKGQQFTIRELNKKTIATGIITKVLKSLHFDKKKINKVVVPDL